MQFSTSFYFHFILSFAAYQMFGIYLCRGSWRNVLRQPFFIGMILLVLSHMRLPYSSWMIVPILAIILFCVPIWRAFKSNHFAPSVVRDGHNFLGVLVGAALFAITSQLHAVLFGVPVFQLVK
jgi:hypothetical protein